LAPLKEIKRIILHCTATPDQRDVDISDVARWHKQDNKWDDIGYHFLIKRNGVVQEGRSIKYQGAHTFRENHDSIGIAWVGTKEPSRYQMSSLLNMYSFCKAKWGIGPLQWRGHNEFSKKECPGFSMEIFRAMLYWYDKSTS
jgi:N-acetylmuramoyl-L-alanine amidase